MPTPTFQPPQGQQDLGSLQDYIIKLIRDLNFMLSNLDTLNVNRLDAKVIIASTITALQIAAGTITADKMSITELSAIAANLGTITAGIIYGAYIATANGTYPRIELSSVGNLLSALKTATNKMYVDPTYTGPALIFDDGFMQAQLFAFTVIGSGFAINSDHNLNLSAPSGSLSAQSSAGTINDIVTDINAKATTAALTSGLASKADSGGFTSSVSVSDSHNHGISSTDYIQLYDSAGNPTTLTQWAPWAGSPAHSHTI